MESAEVSTNGHSFIDTPISTILALHQLKPMCSLHEMVEMDTGIDNPALGDFSQFYKYKYVARGDRITEDYLKEVLKKEKKYYLYSTRPQILLAAPIGIPDTARSPILKNCKDIIGQVHNIAVDCYSKVRAHQYRNVDLGVLFIHRDQIQNRQLFSFMKEFVYTRCRLCLIVVVGVPQGKEKSAFCDDKTAEQVYARVPSYAQNKTLAFSYNQKPSEFQCDLFRNLVFERTKVFVLEHDELKKYSKALTAPQK